MSDASQPASLKDPLSLVILAAGLGSRFGGTKQIEGVGPNGETLLEVGMEDAWKAGFKKCVLVVSPAVPGSFRDRLTASWFGRLELVFVEQRADDLPLPVPASGRTKPWGTGHALYSARSQVRGSFAVMNADDYYGLEAFQKLAAFLNVGADYALVGYQLGKTLSENGTVSRGLCRVEDGDRVLEIEETHHIRNGPAGVGVYNQDGICERRLSPNQPVSMNLFGLRPTVWAPLEEGLRQFLQEPRNLIKGEYPLPGAVRHAAGLHHLELRLLPTSSPWYGVTYAADRLAVRQFLHKLRAVE